MITSYIVPFYTILIDVIEKSHASFDAAINVEFCKKDIVCIEGAFYNLVLIAAKYNFYLHILSLLMCTFIVYYLHCLVVERPYQQIAICDQCKTKAGMPILEELSW